MSAIPFVPPLDDVVYGAVVPVSPMIRRVIADNPSRFTYRGTGTYIVGHGDVVVIDPGPILDTHRDALAAALDGERVRAILITHCHADHSPLAAWLREHSGAPTVGYGAHHASTPALVTNDGDDDALEEAIDIGFRPDIVVRDGDLISEAPGVTMRAVHTPGHTSNHVCYAFDEEQALFSGDHVMGWSTTVVSPPDGDMRDYLDSLRRVIDRRDATLWPTHGNPIIDPAPFLDAYLQHRLERERQVLERVRGGASSIAAMVTEMYAAVDVELHPAARRSVLAHVLKLFDDGLIATADGRRPQESSTLVAV